MATVVEELVALFGFDVDERTLQRANRAIDRTERNMRDATQASDRLGMGIQGALVAWLGFDQALQAAQGLTRMNAQAEQHAAQLETVEGSATAAAAAYARLTEFAADTPFTLDQTVDAFIRLRNIGLDPSERALRAYGDTAASMGKSMMDMIEAVADASTGEFERLKEFGIRASSQGDQVTFTFRGVETTVRKTSAEIEQYLMNLSETSFGGAMERQMGTLNGLFSNLQDAVYQFALAVGQGGFNDGLRELTEVLIAMVRGGGDAATVIGRVLGGALNRAAAALAWFDANAALVVTFLSWMGGTAAVAGILAVASAIQSMGTTALVAQAKMLAIPAAIAAIGILAALAYDDLNAWLNGHDSLIGRLIARYPELEEKLQGLRNTMLDVREYGDSALQGFRDDLDAVISSLGRLGPALREVPLIGALLGGDVTPGSILQGINPVANTLESLGFDVASLFGGGPDPLGAAGGASARGLQVAADYARGQTSVGGGFVERAENAPVTFSVGDINFNMTQAPNESPEEFAERAGSQFMRQLRQSARLLP